MRFFAVCLALLGHGSRGVRRGDPSGADLLHESEALGWVTVQPVSLSDLAAWKSEKWTALDPRVPPIRRDGRGRRADTAARALSELKPPATEDKDWVFRRPRAAPKLLERVRASGE